MQRKYNRSTSQGSFGGVVVISVTGVVALIVWIISGIQGNQATQEANPDVTREFTGKIESAVEIDSDFLTHSFLAYNILAEEWQTSWSYYEKETWEFYLKLDNGTMITCHKVFLANTVNINLYYSDVDGEIPVGITAKVTGSFGDNLAIFDVNEIINTATGGEIELHAPALPPGTVSAPAPAAA